ncbi:MAG: hypothetical protein QXX23_07625 [Thermoplasmata archaeon]|uniref:hypothetical protein n=1 Tax=Saccharolobus sp. TaxID=2100761 RepID=UPI003166CF95
MSLLTTQRPDIPLVGSELIYAVITAIIVALMNNYLSSVSPLYMIVIGIALIALAKGEFVGGIMRSLGLYLSAFGIAQVIDQRVQVSL